MEYNIFLLDERVEITLFIFFSNVRCTRYHQVLGYDQMKYDVNDLSVPLKNLYIVKCSMLVITSRKVLLSFPDLETTISTHEPFLSNFLNIYIRFLSKFIVSILFSYFNFSNVIHKTLSIDFNRRVYCIELFLLVMLCFKFNCFYSSERNFTQKPCLIIMKKIELNR